jgi:uncharacterized protein (TIRG00374 family)
VGALLLLWIFHSIFVNEARELARRGELHDGASRVQWRSLSRPEQWQYGWRFGPPALGRTLGSIDPGMLLLSFALMGGTLALGVIRWRMVLRVQGLPLSFSRAAEIALVAHFFNSFLLGTAGGDVMKAYYAARETHHKKTEAVVTVFVDRLVGLWVMLLFAAIMMIPNQALFRGPGVRTAGAIILAMALGGTLVVFLAFRGGVSRAWSGAHSWLRRLPKGEWLERSLESCRKFGREPGFVTRAVALSMLLNAVCVLQFLVVARGLGVSIPSLVLFMIVPMIIAISALPISPSGLGVRENLFVHMLALPAIGVHATQALSLSLLAFAGSLFWSVVGGIVYMMFKQKHHLAEQELASEPPEA